MPELAWIGELAPLPALLALGDAFDAFLLVDDAHGFWRCSDRPGNAAAWRIYGIDPAQHFLVSSTSARRQGGASGRLVPVMMKSSNGLLQRARTYIFTTGAPPWNPQRRLRDGPFHRSSYSGISDS